MKWWLIAAIKPSTDQFAMDLKALKGNDIYVYSGCGTTVDTFDAGEEDGKSVLLPVTTLPLSMKEALPGQDQSNHTIPALIVFDCCFLNPETFPAMLTQAGCQVVIAPTINTYPLRKPGERANSVASASAIAVGILMRKLLNEGATFSEAVEAANDCVRQHNTSVGGAAHYTGEYRATYGGGVTGNDTFFDLSR